MKNCRTEPDGDALIARRTRARLIYAASEHCADLLHVSGLMAPDPFLWFSLRGRNAIVVSPLEFGRALKQVKPGTAVYSTEQLRREWQLPTQALRMSEIIAALARREKVRHWSVPGDFPLALAQRLSRLGLYLRAVPQFCPDRAVKSTNDVAAIRDGVAIAEAGLARAFAVLRASRILMDGSLEWDGRALTSEIVRGEIDAEVARRGGTASQTIAAAGCQAADPHQAGYGVLRANTPIVFDIFPRVDRTGFHGDLTRTVVKGKATDIVHRAFAAVQAARDSAIAGVRAGVKPCSLQRQALMLLEQTGFHTDLKGTPPRGFFHGLGHGLGLDVHEPPRVNSRARQPLVVGNVITIEPGLYYPEWGGVRLEDVVVVEARGCHNLTSTPTFLEIP